jgi:hypothetical protein
VSPRENGNQFPAEIAKANYQLTRREKTKNLPTKMKILLFLHLCLAVAKN